MRRCGLSSIVLALALISLCAAQPVYFADADLKAVVEQALGKTDPTPTDMLALTSLDAGGRGISDLTGIEYGTNLSYLHLNANEITDLSPLSSLVSLEWLLLTSNQISDVSPLAGLNSLRHLALRANQIGGISPLAGLASLNSLDLAGNQIHDIGPLANLTALETLHLGGNPVSDISVLANLTSLWLLGLAGTHITDFSPLASLTGLADLGLDRNHLSDISFLASLGSLTDLNLMGNQISDISVLAGLTSLDWLDLADNEVITDISPLANLTSLRYLNLRTNQISDISPLGHLTSLRELYVENNQISDISVLADLTSLNRLWVHINRISDISSLAHLTHLSSLWLMSNPLSTAAYTTFIPVVQANNPGIELRYDPPVWQTLTFSASEGGSVLTPGEGQFQVNSGTVLTIEAVPADSDHEFSRWSGTAVDSGKVQDPNASRTTLVVDGDYALEAAFRRRTQGPVLGFSLGELTADDPQQFDYRVTTNNTPRVVLVERVTGTMPDPNGMMRMQVIEGEPAQASTRFGKCSAPRMLVRFSYLFERWAPGLELVACLSDRPKLLGPDDPNREGHYREVGRVAVPPEDCPGAVDSGRFGIFEEWVSTEGLDLSQGTWLALELVEAQMQTVAAGSSSGPIHVASYQGGGSVYIDGQDLQVHCGICMDLTGDDVADEEDFVRVIGAAGKRAELGKDGKKGLVCHEGPLSRDGYVDVYDACSWDWLLRSLSRVNRGNLCRWTLPLLGNSSTAKVGASQRALGDMSRMQVAGAGSLSGEWLLLGKGRYHGALSDLLADRFCLFDGPSAFVATYSATNLPTRCNVRVVRGRGDDVYVINSERGVLRIDGQIEEVIPPGRVSDVNDPRHPGLATVYIGIQGEGSDTFGRPILDVAFDRQGYAYVAPVVVEPADRDAVLRIGGSAYVAAAKLALRPGDDPPYGVVRLYDDPPVIGDNRRRDGVREIEVDDANNVYLVNAHKSPESCILWKYVPEGTMLKPLYLTKSDSPVQVEDPLALHVSRDGQTLYLASGQYQADPNTAVVYALSTKDFSRRPSIVIRGLQFVTAIAEDANSLWVVGFSMPKIPKTPNPLAEPFYVPYVAVVPPDSNDVNAVPLAGSGNRDLVLPVSVVWVGATP